MNYLLVHHRQTLTREMAALAAHVFFWDQLPGERQEAEAGSCVRLLCDAAAGEQCVPQALLSMLRQWHEVQSSVSPAALQRRLQQLAKGPRGGLLALHVEAQAAALVLEREQGDAVTCRIYRLDVPNATAVSSSGTVTGVFPADAIAGIPTARLVDGNFAKQVSSSLQPCLF
jgi:hypothetical protein